MYKKTLILTLTVCAAALLSIPQPAYAQISEFKITAADGAAGDQFGHSVSISGEYAVLGALGDDDNNGISTGSAFLFRRTDTSWTQMAKFLASDGGIGDGFGYSVSIPDDYSIIGAFDHPNGSQSGAAYVYSGIIVGIDDERAGLTAEFALSQNYPNPFNPNTVIKYTLPNRSEVKLIIYNLRGEEVAFLLNGSMPAGHHQVSWDASNFASGIYFYRLRAGDFVQTRKMVLLR